MLPVQNVSARAFKGRDFSLDFKKPVTVIVGSNSKGKSARIEALYLALLGYVPDEKPLKAGRALFDTYSSGQRMEVSVSGQIPVRRSWKLNKSTVKYDGPKEDQIPPTVVDPSAYLSLSGPERTRHLFMEFVDADAQDVLNQVAAELKANVTGGPDVERLARETAGSIKPPAQGQAINEWMEKLVDDAREQRKVADANYKRLQEAVRANAQLSDSERPDEQAEVDLAALEKELNASTAQQQEIERQQSKTREEWRDAKAAAEELKRLELPDIEELEKALPERPAQPKPDTSMQTRLNTVLTEETKLRSELQSEQAVLKKLKSDTKCPTCGSDISDAQKPNIERYELKISQHERNLAELQPKIDSWTADVERAKQEFDQQQAEFNRYVEALNNLNGAREAHARHEQLRQKSGRLAELEESGREAGQKMDAIRQNIEQMGPAIAEAQQAANALKQWRAAQAAAQRTADELKTAQDIRVVRRAWVDTLEEKMRELVAQAVAPLLTTMNSLCAPILPGLVEFKDGELLLAGHAHRSASDSEKLLIYASLCVALAARSEFKLAVIGRLESFDYEKRPQLIGLLRDLTRQQVIGQAVLVGVQPGREVETYGEDVQVEVVD